MKVLFFAVLTLFIGIQFSTQATENNPLRIVHYNIKELHSLKIHSQLGASNLNQLQAVRNILLRLRPELLSLNEVQYDLPGVPDSSFVTSGENLNKLSAQFGMAGAASVFYPANTGALSEPRPDGTYVVSSPTAEERQLYSDPLNFGMFPAQYSTGLLSLKPVGRVKEYSQILWSQVSPTLDLSQFNDGNGQPLPEDMLLFDKNFTHVEIQFQGKPLHVIVFHSVPAFHFGNDKSPNYQRNKDQLRFLQWYLGSDRSGIEGIEGVTPLSPGDSFVAMGDWNVDVGSDNLGAEVIRAFYDEFQMWMADPVITYIGSSLAPGGFKAQLDYILLSKDLKVSRAGVYSAEESREELGCTKHSGRGYDQPGKVVVRYRNADGVSCAAAISERYHELITASDHLPLFVDITR